VFVPERQSPILNLDSLPLSAYHLIDLDREAYYWHGMGKRAFGLSTSRGCGDRCAYCSETRFWNGIWRGRSGRKIVEEISYLHDRHGKASSFLTKILLTGAGKGWKNSWMPWENQG
jgi:radical SAM superfamily enzyme YgiQ (UPF0313 family)